MINFGVTEQKSQELQRRMHNCNLLENDIEEGTGTYYKNGVIAKGMGWDYVKIANGGNRKTK